MHKLIGLLIVGAVLGFGQMASAGPYEDGLAAYKQRDYATALKLLRPLAEQGNAAAQNVLGVMYEIGRGVPQDDMEAVKWYRLSAEQGRASAQYNLGVMYDKGQGVPQDYVRAHMWLNLAAASFCGDEAKTASESRHELTAKMSPAQIERAQEMARKCQESKFKDCGW